VSRQGPGHGGGVTTRQLTPDLFALVRYSYGTAFTVAVVLIELHYRPFYSSLPWFRNWAVRGFFLIFVGLLALNLAPINDVRVPFSFASYTRLRSSTD
jgi:hypothetical protein